MCCIMKSVTIREVQHNLAKILRTVEEGERVEILRRNKPVAQLIAVKEEEHAGQVDWNGHAERMQAIWSAPPVAMTDRVLDDLRGSR